MTAKRWPQWGQVLTQLLALALVFVHQTQAKAEVTGAASAPAAVPTGPHYSAKDFAIGSPLDSLRLSPDGKRYAAIIRKGAQALIVVRSVAGGDYRIVRTTDDRIVEFNWIHWINNDRFAISVQRSIHGTEYADTLLTAVNADGSNFINLHNIHGNAGGNWFSPEQDNVVDWLPEDGQHILLAYPADGAGLEQEVFKVDVNTGLRTLYQRSRENVYDWEADQAHRMRVSVAWDPEDHTTSVSYCDPEGKTWHLLRQFKQFDTAAVWPLGFGLDPNILYALADHAGLKAVVTFDLREPEPQAHLLIADPQQDINGYLARDVKTHEAVGVFSLGPEGYRAYFWDAQYKALTGGIDKALPGRANVLVQMLADGSTYLMNSYSSSVPGQYLIGDRKTGSLTLLAERYSQFEPEQLAAKEAITIKARDGTTLHGFLTLPLGREPKNLPLVVIPHDYPSSWDGPYYEPWSAFLADRGYAVLQINYRGSGGQGYAFVQAGLKHWGQDMQDDLADAALALVNQGIVDRQRMAIVGDGYGGYAALMAGVKTPDLFKGIVAYAPLTNLVRSVKDGQFYHRRYSAFMTEQFLGTLPGDEQRLTYTSPALQASLIQTPVLLISGATFLSYGEKQGDWMVDALKDADKHFRSVNLRDKSDYVWGYQDYVEAQIRLLTEMEKFLGDVLGKKMSLNGHPAVAIINSGATASLIDSSQAGQFGATLANPDESVFLIRGIGRSGVKTYAVRFNSLSAGDETIQQAVVMTADLSSTWHEEQPYQVVLGADFLKTHRVLFANSQRQLYFS